MKKLIEINNITGEVLHSVEFATIEEAKAELHRWMSLAYTDRDGVWETCDGTVIDPVGDESYVIGNTTYYIS